MRYRLSLLLLLVVGVVASGSMTLLEGSTPGQWYDLAVHNHTSEFSDGNNTFVEMVQKAKDLGYDGIVISDHDHMAFNNITLYNPGFEEGQGQTEVDDWVPFFSKGDGPWDFSWTGRSTYQPLVGDWSGRMIGQNGSLDMETLEFMQRQTIRESLANDIHLRFKVYPVPGKWDGSAWWDTTAETDGLAIVDVKLLYRGATTSNRYIRFLIADGSWVDSGFVRHVPLTFQWSTVNEYDFNISELAVSLFGGEAYQYWGEQLTILIGTRNNAWVEVYFDDFDWYREVPDGAWQKYKALAVEHTTPDFLVMAGEEIQGMGINGPLHITAIAIAQPIPGKVKGLTVQQVFENIHGQGGVGIVNHAMAEGSWSQWTVQEGLLADGWELYSGLVDTDANTYGQVLETKALFSIGASDSHHAIQLETYGYTRVWAASLTETAILDALKAGLTWPIPPGFKRPNEW